MWPSSTPTTISTRPLNTFRQAYGLPACTTANGCFKKVNQNGATSPLPSGDYGWAEEESLDLDAVSSACPTCHILLVEANSASTSALSKAENSAAKAAGVVAISNSYGGSEASSETSTDSPTTTQASPSPSAPATAATAWSTRRRRGT